MRTVPGQTFLMGSASHYPEEAPQRPCAVDTFEIDVQPVTNAKFAEFVAETGHLTAAEQELDPSSFPGAALDLLQPASLVFTRPRMIPQSDDLKQWWSLVPGANWRKPSGPASSIDGLGDHPVVHVAFADAVAFATWADKSLPTEAEWECAARGGLAGKEFAWGDTLRIDGRLPANIWEGTFPHRHNRGARGGRTTPVRSYPPNPFGLYDMIGNVWEWTADAFTTAGQARVKECCTGDRAVAGMSRVLKGGSHLCADNYCMRYRPAARIAQETTSGTSHIGFRCVRRSSREYGARG